MDAQRTLTVAALVEAGFAEIGCWQADHRGLVVPNDLPGKAGVYAFALDERVQYVGLASGSIKQRFGFYARPGSTQSTNIRLNALMRELIGGGQSVRILLAHPADGIWNGLRVSGPEGLEAALIKDYQLPWNKRGVIIAPPLPAAVETIRLKRNASPEIGGAIRPSGSLAVRSMIIEFVAKHPGSTERELAQGLFGRSGVQQQVNAYCRELVKVGRLERLPTSPITYKLGRNARFG